MNAFPKCEKALIRCKELKDNKCIIYYAWLHQKSIHAWQYSCYANLWQNDSNIYKLSNYLEWNIEHMSGILSELEKMPSCWK